ncbi:MAG TPA: LamG-like jellyroll fold domain-containing protein, partial [Polyangiales bacterium]|nr:LamG-like jellyroll fold domain-containing protein [Polyangiales bacterium]
KRGFVPRDPGPVRTQNVDAATTDPGPSNPTGTSDPVDASTPTVTPMQDAQVAPVVDAQVTPVVDARVVPAADTGTTPPVATTDAQAPPAVDAGVPVVDVGPPPPAALPQPIHRYEFEGEARVALDSIGGAHGELQGRAYMAGMGEVQLGGMYEDAVVLPPRIMMGVQSFTMLGWMVPRTEECTQRLFEFIYYREGQQRTQVSALYLAPYACPDSRPAVGYLTERGITNVVSDQALNGAREQVLLGAMYDANTQELALIVNGVIAQRATAMIQPRELTASQGSLGRSSPEGESPFGSSIAEFRIYNQTLDETTLAEIARRGPDQL